MTLRKFLKVFSSLDTEVNLYNASGVAVYDGEIKNIPSEYVLVRYLVDRAYVSKSGVFRIFIKQKEGEK